MNNNRTARVERISAHFHQIWSSHVADWQRTGKRCTKFESARADLELSIVLWAFSLKL